MTIWQPGMRCVCISERYSKHSAPACGLVANLPKKGFVYTVRHVFCDHLLLVEIVNPIGDWLGGRFEYCFSPKRFRPLSEQRLDQFRVHLAPAPCEPVDA